jgi:hypothetical protein
MPNKMGPTARKTGITSIKLQCVKRKHRNYLACWGPREYKSTDLILSSTLCYSETMLVYYLGIGAYALACFFFFSITGKWHFWLQMLEVMPKYSFSVWDITLAQVLNTTESLNFISALPQIKIVLGTSLTTLSVTGDKDKIDWGTESICTLSKLGMISIRKKSILLSPISK